MAKVPKKKAPGSRPAAAVLEEIAGAVMAADPSDPAAATALLDLLRELAADPGAERSGLAAAAARSAQALADALKGPPAGLGPALDAVSVVTAEMQDAALRSGRPGDGKDAAPPEDPGKLVLPEWGDERTLHDFVDGQRAVLEEIESDILAMEKGDAAKRASFRRKIHTLKGEAGVLALDDLEAVCHAVEDFLEAAGASADATDRLLKVRDWMVASLASYSRLRKPEPNAATVAAEWLRLAASGPAAPQAPAKATPPQAPAKAAPPQAPAKAAPAQAPATAAPPAPGPSARAPVPPGSVERDAETVGLFGEFLSESAEGLAKVDQMLMNTERDGADAEAVNGLFRVFHTIKGTAGFLDLAEVVDLAHTTETMLNRCREGALALQGAVVDLVFDSTAAMRKMLDEIRAAIEKGAALPSAGDLGGLLGRIRAATEGRPVPEKEIPCCEPGARLGEVVTKPPIGVAPEAVEKALERQRTTGNRLGEELVASGAAGAEQVALALRAQARGAQSDSVKLKETIKVDLESVDSLLAMIGELVVVESMVVNAPEIAGSASLRARNCLSQLAKVTRDLQDVGMRMRMVPVSGVFQKMARIARDLSRKSGKQVRLVTAGEATEMDRSMVEQVADPLVHMIRNAMDHGLEAPEERKRSGKPAGGVIRLSACHEGGSVVIELADDGRGLDRERIVRKAIEKGLVTSTEGMSDSDIYGLIFAPGFSTASQVTEISGRGVGMDVVKRSVEAMHGRVVISTFPGQGTTFRIVLPLTLAIIDGMLVACGAERYIIPTLSIVESIQPDRKMLLSLAQKHEMINLRGQILPLLRLDRLFGLPGAKTDPTEALVVVVEGVGHRLGLLVDEVITQQQVVIKSLGQGINDSKMLSGAAILGDGRVGLILNVERIADLVGNRPAAVVRSGDIARPVPITGRPNSAEERRA